MLFKNKDPDPDPNCEKGRIRTIQLTVLREKSTGDRLEFMDGPVSSYYQTMMKKGITFQMWKGQSNEIFDPQFVSSFELVWATDQRVKIF